jgi:choice-of-anchor C domain-containing protein
MKNLLLILALTLGLGLTSASAQLVNGSFEGSGLTGSYNPLLNGSNAIPGWIVGDLGAGGQHGVDLITTYWKASDGNDSIDLSGWEAGSISQTFATVAGTTYRVTFDMSGNPDDGRGVYTLSAVATGNAPVSYNYDTTAAGNTSGMSGDMKWQTMTYEFTATGSSTTLTFSDITSPVVNNAYDGPALDNVTLTEVAPASGLVCHRNSSKGKASFKTLNMTDPASYADHIGHGDAAGACPAN